MPAGGELYAIYGNKNVLNITLGKIEGTRLGSDYTSGYWSSSESSSSDAWKLPFNDGAMYCGDKNGNYAYVLPVLAF